MVICVIGTAQPNQDGRFGRHGKYKSPAEVLPEDMEDGEGAAGRQGGVPGQLRGPGIRGQSERPQPRAKVDSGRFEEVTDEQAAALQANAGKWNVLGVFLMGGSFAYIGLL